MTNPCDCGCYSEGKILQTLAEGYTKKGKALRWCKTKEFGEVLLHYYQGWEVDNKQVVCGIVCDQDGEPVSKADFQ